MKTNNKKITQIVQGILTALALWGIGIMLSGKLASGDILELYHTGPLIILFPLIVLASFILIAKYAIIKKKYVYYKTTIICFAVPFIGWFLSLSLNLIAQATTPIISYIANWISLIFTLPLVSVYSQLLSLIPTSIDGTLLVLISIVYFIPMAIGLIISLKLYKDKTKICCHLTTKKTIG